VFLFTYLKRLERDIKIAWVGGNIFHVMTLPPGFLNMIGKNGGTEDAIQTIFQKQIEFKKYIFRLF